MPPPNTVVEVPDGETLPQAAARLSEPIPFSAYADLIALHLDSTTVEDIDQLWDWVRADRDGTTAFLNQAHANSQSFHQQIASIVQDGTAWFRSIRRGEALLGFTLVKTAKTPLTGMIGIYLEPSQRGLIKDVIAEIVTQANPQMTLMCLTTDQGLADLFTDCGFTSQYVLTRPASHAATGDAR